MSTLQQLNTVFLENEDLKISVIPELGGKISSMIWKPSHFQFAAQPKGKYEKPKFGDDFSLFDASGIDDCFPCLHAGIDSISGYKYPDHGEIWSASMDCRHESSSVSLAYESPHFPYRYEKNISICNNSVFLNYHIENIGKNPFPCIWAFHGLMRYEEGMKINYPADTTSFLNVLDSALLGKAGTMHSIDGNYDFRRPPKASPPSMVKYYLANPVPQGQCSFYYPSHKLGCRLFYDSKLLPYLGVWITAGEFRGDYNCALEPCNGFYDDIETSRKNNAVYFLKPETPLVFTLEMEIFNSQ